MSNAEMNTPATAVSTVNISELVDRSRIGSLQMRTFAMCLLCLIMNGFDVQTLGFSVLADESAAARCRLASPCFFPR